MKDAQVAFNTNVVYHGATLHIQTEDSGLGRPHVITHLYREGTILATRRSSYEPSGEPAEVRDRVRALMKAQHKQVILDLRDGVFDEVVDRAVAGVGPATDEAASAAVESSVEPVAASVEEVAPPVAVASTWARPTPAEGTGPHPVLTPADGRSRPSYRPPTPGPAEPDRVRPAAVEASGPVAVGRPRRPTPLRPTVQREREGFGKELISDRSLDEVVLSYLAEELTKEDK